MIRFRRTTPVDPNASAYLFPPVASLEPSGNAWRIALHGMIFREGRLSLGKRLMLGVLRRAMRASKQSMESELFQRRIRGFLCDAEAGKSLSVRLGERATPLKRLSKRNGMFQDEILIPADEHDAEKHLELLDEAGNVRARSSVMFLPRRGVSVVSDIDDTVKHTHVEHRRAMLENTFLKEFLPIDGMSELYRTWADRGAAFHYVSSSPWQLFAPLADYFAEHEFPDGSLHLRAFRLRDHMLRRIFFGRRPVKGAVIRELMQRFPLRKFVLVGDSAELDPEIYGTLARKFPQQTSAILIRRVSEPKRNEAKRFARAFRKLPSESWRIYDDAEELRNDSELASVIAARED